MRRIILPVIAAAMLVAAPTAGADTALNVVPWGQTEPGASWLTAPGILPADTQALMYDRLTPLFRDVTDAQLAPSTDGTGYFKPEVLRDENDPAYITAETVSGAVPGRAETLSARIKRDAYGVPAVYSDTDDGVVFGAGWVTGEDRNVLLAVARDNAYAAAVDLPGVAADRLILGGGNYKPSQAAIDEVTRTQTKALEDGGSEGQAVLHDIDTFVAGINGWRAANSPSTKPFTRADIYALNAFKGQFLGEGGGTEVQNALALDAFQHRLGARRGAQAYTDLRQRSNPDSPVTIDKSFRFQTKVPVRGARGRVGLQSGSFTSTAPKCPESVGRTTRREASNALLVSGQRSASGVPIMVAGPQLPYTYPGFTLEIGLYGPNVRSVGVTSAPFPGYMLIGRGANFAWSLTSAGGDIIDTYAETLCGGSKTRYRYKGKCRKMTTLKAGALTQGTVTRNVTVRRTVHGPVIGYARDARTHKLVALTKKRSTAGRDVLDQRFFRRLTFGTIGSAKDFIDAAATTPQTFNSFYVSKSEIAEITTGRLPVRPKNVNPDLPVDGRGRFEWRGYLSAKGHPHVTNPPSGLIVNWNNKPAKNFPAGDDRWSEGSIMRSELLTGELARTAKHTPATVTAAMNAAATEDVREVQLWPVLKAVLAKAPSPSARATSMAAQLQNWYEKGGSRLDRDGDGKIDSAGVVSLDNAWAGMARAAMCGRLGTSGCDALETRMSVFDQPPGGQYAGWHQYMDKDLRTLLGRKVKGKYGLRYCGKGSVKACAKSLWAAIDAAGAKVSAAQGDDPSTWREASEVTRFAPLPLTTIRYTNRPSGIQQVIQFGAAR